ncbi:hypothetical protein ABIC03_003558 [Bradyrhizobium sp. RT6a]
MHGVFSVLGYFSERHPFRHLLVRWRTARRFSTPVKRGECGDQSGPAVVMQDGVLGVAAELVDWPPRRYDLRHGTDQKADRLPRLRPPGFTECVGLPKLRLEGAVRSPILHRKGPPIYNVEARNDLNMVVFAGTLGGLGAACGFVTSAGPLSAALLVTSCSMLGVLAGVPLAALFNITRRLWR